MLLIALAGGTVAERRQIADRLVASGKGFLVSFDQPAPMADRAEARTRTLRDALEGLNDQAVAPVPGVVVTHCLSEEEAVLVRARGGVLWHVYGYPSGLVVIRQGDTIVTSREEGFRHVLDPMEALSEVMLSRMASGKAGHARAALGKLAHA